jgi:hypothetical protein
METTLTVVFTPTASAQLIVEEIAPGFYMLLDNDIETLTPSYLGLKCNSVIIAKKLEDGVLEFVAISTKKAAKKSKKTTARNKQKKVAKTGQGSPFGNFIIRLLIAIGTVLFLLSAFVHFSTFLQFEPPIQMSDAWALHVLIFAVFMAHKVATILCTIVLAGFIPTLTCTVKLVSLTKSGPNMLLDGKEVNIAVYGLMFFLVMFPLVALTLGALTELMNCFGRNFSKDTLT